jgi:prephenate dehydratase
LNPRPRAAFQGAFGAFSHEACLACLPQAEPVPYDAFDHVFRAVQQGECAYAFVPVENTIAGPVPEVAALLPTSGLQVLDSHDWPIRLHLMAAPGVALANLRRVASHPMALKQCGRFLAEHGLQAEAAFDTAGAAAALSRRPSPEQGVAAPRPAAALYGLHILAEDIQDRTDNTTRFLVLRPAS